MSGTDSGPRAVGSRPPAGCPSGRPAEVPAGFRLRLHLVYTGFTLCFVLFLLAIGGLEQLGLSRKVIGFVFLVGPLVVYAVIGVLSRTTDPTEYYVAGRRVPAIYNGMATGATG